MDLKGKKATIIHETVETNSYFFYNVQNQEANAP